MRAPTQIVVNEQDWLSLEKMLTQVPASPYSEWLETELDRAKIIPAGSVTPGLVTMNSRIRYYDVSAGKEKEVTLVYPKDADVKSGRVSILAPVGAALLGLSVGQTIKWKMPNGREKTLRVREVIYQPESFEQAVGG